MSVSTRVCIHVFANNSTFLTFVETRDGKKSYDPAPHSKEMLALNKKFGRVHGISSLINMAAFLATIYYGVVLSKRLE